MDQIVAAAMRKWPTVPHCYGWLALDARGDWYLRDEPTQLAGPFSKFKGSRIEHDGLRGFIQRNYECDAAGCWFFQNGPQRVYVELEAAPLIQMPHRLFWAVLYVPILLWLVVKANLDVAWRVVHPRMPIRPGIVKAKTVLKTAAGRVLMRPETLEALRQGNLPKGDVLGAARIAGIMAAKRTSELIPLCHPLLLSGITLDFAFDESAVAVEIRDHEQRKALVALAHRGEAHLADKGLLQRRLRRGDLHEVVVLAFVARAAAGKLVAEGDRVLRLEGGFGYLL